MFNNNYYEFLNRMLKYQSHSKKFLELDESSQIKNISEFCNKIYQDENISENSKIQKPDLIKEIVYNRKPYIFLFILDVFTLFTTVTKNNKEKKALSSKENPTKENLSQDFTKEIKDLKKILIIFFFILIFLIIILIFIMLFNLLTLLNLSNK